MSGRTVIGTQNVSRMCLVCGVDNALGLQGHFYELDGGELAGVFHPKCEHQGYPGRMHGGLATAILDEVIGRAVNLRDPGTWGVTVELKVRFRKPVPLDGPVRAVGRIDGEVRRLFKGSGEIVLQDGTVAVEAHGRFLRVALEDIADTTFVEQEWFEDSVPPPDEVDL